MHFFHLRRAPSCTLRPHLGCGPGSGVSPARGHLPINYFVWRKPKTDSRPHKPSQHPHPPRAETAVGECERGGPLDMPSRPCKTARRARPTGRLRRGRPVVVGTTGHAALCSRCACCARGAPALWGACSRRPPGCMGPCGIPDTVGAAPVRLLGLQRLGPTRGGWPRAGRPLPVPQPQACPGSQGADPRADGTDPGDGPRGTGTLTAAAPAGPTRSCGVGGQADRDPCAVHPAARGKLSPRCSVGGNHASYHGYIFRRVAQPE